MGMMAPSETSPLLNGGKIDRSTSNDRRTRFNTIKEHSEPQFPKTDGDFNTTWKIESKILGKNSAPLVLTYLLQYSYNLVMVYVAGRIGTNEQGAASLATMTANITGLCVYEGLASALDTLTSQAYGGGRKHMVGIHLQRMCALVLAMSIPIGILWIFSPWILTRLVPDATIAELAGSYMRYLFLGAPGYGIFEAGKRFTQAQGNFTASLVAVLICAPLNILWNWLFVFRLGFGYTGAALAIALTYTLQPLVLLLYINLFARPLLNCWPGISRRAFQNWGQMLKLSFPCIFMVLSEWLAFEFLTFTSSYISNPALAAQSVLINITIAMYHIPNPIAIAASTRFGIFLGNGALTAARKTWVLYYVVHICIGLFDMVLLMSLRHFIAGSFTDDSAVHDLIMTTIPIVAAAELFDSLACISNGLLKGMGRQKIGGMVNLGVYYLWAIPLSLFLTFGPPNLGLVGLWIGPLTGLGMVTVVITIYLRCSDWQKAVDEARAREE